MTGSKSNNKGGASPPKFIPIERASVYDRFAPAQPPKTIPPLVGLEGIVCDNPAFYFERQAAFMKKPTGIIPARLFDGLTIRFEDYGLAINEWGLTSDQQLLWMHSESMPRLPDNKFIGDQIVTKWGMGWATPSMILRDLPTLPPGTADYLNSVVAPRARRAKGNTGTKRKVFDIPFSECRPGIIPPYRDFRSMELLVYLIAGSIDEEEFYDNPAAQPGRPHYLEETGSRQCLSSKPVFWDCEVIKNLRDSMVEMSRLYADCNDNSDLNTPAENGYFFANWLTPRVIKAVNQYVKPVINHLPGLPNVVNSRWLSLAIFPGVWLEVIKLAAMKRSWYEILWQYSINAIKERDTNYAEYLEREVEKMRAQIPRASLATTDQLPPPSRRVAHNHIRTNISAIDRSGSLREAREALRRLNSPVMVSLAQLQTAIEQLAIENIDLDQNIALLEAMSAALSRVFHENGSEAGINALVSLSRIIDDTLAALPADRRAELQNLINVERVQAQLDRNSRSDHIEEALTAADAISAIVNGSRLSARDFEALQQQQPVIEETTPAESLIGAPQVRRAVGWAELHLLSNFSIVESEATIVVNSFETFCSRLARRFPSTSPQPVRIERKTELLGLAMINVINLPSALDHHQWHSLYRLCAYILNETTYRPALTIPAFSAWIRRVIHNVLIAESVLTGDLSEDNARALFSNVELGTLLYVNTIARNAPPTPEELDSGWLEEDDYDIDDLPEWVDDDELPF